MHRRKFLLTASALGAVTIIGCNLTDEAVDVYLAPLVAYPARTRACAITLETNVLAGIEPHLRNSRIPTRVAWGTNG